MRGLILLLLGTAGLGACDQAQTYRAPYDDGDAVPILAEADDRPTTREGYAGLAAFVVGSQYVVLIDPGTGPDDPPRFVRAFDMPEVRGNIAQMDEDGYLWLGSPDEGGSGGALLSMYVLDPFNATIQREIFLPMDLRGIGHLLMTPDRVFLRSWRDGFSGAVAVVDRACATDAARCEPRLFAELGNVGLTGPQALYLRGDTLYSFSNANSRDRRPSFDLLNAQTGATLRSSAVASSSSTMSPDAVHQIVATGPGRIEVLRMDPVTLAVEARVPIVWNGLEQESFIARQGGRLYTAGVADRKVWVRDATTLELLETKTVPLQAGVFALFGFVAPDVLMLDPSTAMDVRTGALLDVGTPWLFYISGGMMLPQGHPLAP